MLTLRDWLDQFSILRAGEVSLRTDQNFDATFAYLREKLGEDQDIRKIKPADADDWRVWLRARGLSESTVCSHIRRAKVLFERACLRELIPRNPFDKLPSTDPAPTKDWYKLTEAEVSHLIQACPSDDWKRLVGLCAYAGLRRGEALRLLYGDLDISRRRLYVRPSGPYETTKERARHCLLECVLSDLMATGDQSGFVVGSLARMEVSTVFKGMVGIQKRAGVVFESPFHALRKFRATHWRQVYPEFVVDAWMGHSASVAKRFYVSIPESYYEPAPV